MNNNSIYTTINESHESPLLQNLLEQMRAAVIETARTVLRLQELSDRLSPPSLIASECVLDSVAPRAPTALINVLQMHICSHRAENERAETVLNHLETII